LTCSGDGSGVWSLLVATRYPNTRAVPPRGSVGATVVPRCVQWGVTCAVATLYQAVYMICVTYLAKLLCTRYRVNSRTGKLYIQYHHYYRR
jgi:hypothetical protein